MARRRAYDWNTPPSATGAPPRLSVATCQFAIGPDIGANLRRIDRLARKAKAGGADVAHFPECALSGYGPPAWPDWNGFDWARLADAEAALSRLARELRLWIVAGTVRRRRRGKPANAVLALDRDGRRIGTYDKRRCSANDRRAFDPGSRPLVLSIEGVRCAVAICMEWSFPELWADHARRGVELIFLSAAADGCARDTNHTHTIPSLMQAYAFLHGFAISVANSARPRQEFASVWIERSGHRGGGCRRGVSGLTVNAVPDDAAQDAFFAMVRAFRADARRRARMGA